MNIKVRENKLYVIEKSAIFNRLKYLFCRYISRILSIVPILCNNITVKLAYFENLIRFISIKFWVQFLRYGLYLNVRLTWDYSKQHLPQTFSNTSN